jgi:hypothetical protein
MNFDNVIKALVTLMITGVFLFLAVEKGGEYTQTLMNLAVAAVSYWVGSSSGSAKKDQLLNEKETKNV